MDASQEKITIVNPLGEKLVGILHDTGSEELIILCHGLNSSKDVDLLVNLANSLAKSGLSVFRFDFSGNGESEGEFQFGNYSKETEDLHAVVLHWMQKGRVVKAILGHSKGGSTILLYASKFKEVHTIVNASGRLDLKEGLDNILGADFLEKIEAGPLDVKDNSGKFTFRVTKESLMERFATDLRKAAQTIPKEIRVMSVHGSEDEAVSVENAYACDKIIGNHTLRIIDGADHMYSKHGKDFEEVVKTFIQDPVANFA